MHSINHHLVLQLYIWFMSSLYQNTGKVAIKLLLTFHSLCFWNWNCQQYARIETELQQLFNQHGCLSRCFNIIWSLQTTTRCVEWWEILVLTICYYTNTLRFLQHIWKYLYWSIHSQLQIIWRNNLKWWKLIYIYRKLECDWRNPNKFFAGEKLLI